MPIFYLKNLQHRSKGKERAYLFYSHLCKHGITVMIELLFSLHHQASIKNWFLFEISLKPWLILFSKFWSRTDKV